MNINKIFLAGNLTRNPEISYTPNQTAVCNFGIANNRKWTSQGGEKKEEACFVDCVAFGKTAETINKWLDKGSPIFIEGRLAYRQWEQQDGMKRSKLEVVVERFEFIPAGEVKKKPEEKKMYDGPTWSASDEDDIPW